LGEDSEDSIQESGVEAALLTALQAPGAGGNKKLSIILLMISIGRLGHQLNKGRQKRSF